jgi:DNA-binding MarR family transcriptional regulator
MGQKTLSTKINQCWTDIYYHLHYQHEEPVTHQAVRLLQHLDVDGQATVGKLSRFLRVSHNTASEHVKRLIEKGWVEKKRSIEDERKVHAVITESGKNVLYRNTQLDEEKLSQLMNDLTQGEQTTIEKAFEILREGAKRCSTFS